MLRQRQQQVEKERHLVLLAWLGQVVLRQQARVQPELLVVVLQVVPAVLVP